MAALSLVKDDRYKEHNAGEGHPESLHRLTVIHELIDAEFSELPLIPPRLATKDELALIHDKKYIDMVARTEGRQFSRIDMDTGLSARSYEIARLAAGGLLEAVDTIVRSSPSASGDSANAAFAFVRPPGHHAEPAVGMGFCLFNNVAIAAEYAKRKHGLKRILIIDWDLHHGNGTQRAFYTDPSVLFFSSHQYPHYPGTGNFDEAGNNEGEGFTVNAPVPSGFGDAEYIPLYEQVLRPIALEYKPELVLVSAGFDPYIKDPLGGIQVTGEGFGDLAAIVLDIARTTCAGNVLFTLEGGYNPEGLRNGVRAVLNVLLGKSLHRSDPAPSPAAQNVIDRIIATHRKYWKSLG
ncbi:MAG TPA: histone deacetylase [Nitrospiraceae bacterium]|nr:histone deacetylase [Nitrospiraceae bacterium]